MARPTLHTPELLRELLDALVREPHSGPTKIAKKNKISPASFFHWQQQSALHEKEQRTDSPFLVEWLGITAMFHRHCQFCRAIAIAQIDSRIIEGATCARQEPLYNPQTGMPFWVVDPKIASDAKSMDDDTWHLVYGLDRDKSDVFARDETGALVQSHRDLPPDPRLLLKAAASLLSGTYGEVVRHDVMIGGVLRIGSTPAPALPPPIDVDFLTVDDVRAPEHTNVLAVAEQPDSVADFEETFGGRRLVECVYMYDEDGRLQKPIDGVVIVENSSAHKLYQEADIAVQTTPARELIEAGYCNDFLLKLATPAESQLVADLRAKLKQRMQRPTPTKAAQMVSPVIHSEPTSAQTPRPPDRSVNRIDGPEQVGYGRPPPGGRSVTL